MPNYNYIDTFLELLKTVSTKIYYKKLLYFGLTLFKCLDTLVYLALKFIDDIIYGNKLKDDITELLKKKKNESFKLLYKTMDDTSKKLNYNDFDKCTELKYYRITDDTDPSILNYKTLIYKEINFKDIDVYMSYQICSKFYSQYKNAREKDSPFCASFILCLQFYRQSLI